MRIAHKSTSVLLVSSLLVTFVNILIISVNMGEYTTFSDMLTSPKVGVGAMISFFLYILVVLSYLVSVRDMFGPNIFRTLQVLNIATLVFMLMVLIFNVSEHSVEHQVFVAILFVFVVLSDIVVTTKSYSLSGVSIMTTVLGMVILLIFAMDLRKVEYEYAAVLYYSMSKILKVIIFQGFVGDYEIVVTVEQVKVKKTKSVFKVTI